MIKCNISFNTGKQNEGTRSINEGTIVTQPSFGKPPRPGQSGER